LALFSRRLSERGDGFATPAAENLHKSRLSRCKKDRETFRPKIDQLW
jgi:hypothetical protein